MIPFIVLVVIIAVIAFYFVGIYNSLVALRNRYLNAFKQIDVQLKRRYDLIPNLVESTKGYLAHERGTLDEVIKARNSAFSASNERPYAGGRSSWWSNGQTNGCC
jgi:LemA protein